MRSREEVTDVIKAYDVRGIVGESITPELITDVGAAFGRLMRKEEAHTIAIGLTCGPAHLNWPEHSPMACCPKEWT